MQPCVSLITSSDMVYRATNFSGVVVLSGGGGGGGGGVCVCVVVVVCVCVGGGGGGGLHTCTPKSPYFCNTAPP